MSFFDRSRRQETYNDALSENERKMVDRLFSDPFSFPLIFKTWLRGFIEEMNPALVQLQGTGGTMIGDFSNHLTDPTNAHPASAIGFTPYSTIAATNVQSAIQEMLDEASTGSFSLGFSIAVHG